MQISIKTMASILLCTTLFCFGTLLSKTRHVTDQKIIAKIKKYEWDLHAKIGVCAINLETDKSFEYRANNSFPMASTRKVAIAADFLQLVDKSSIDLCEKRTLTANNWRPGSGLLSKRTVFENIILSWDELLRLMLEESDNVATDIITDKLGGPAAITSWLKKQGIKGQRLDRDSLRMKMDYDAVRLPIYKAVRPADYQAAQELVSPHELKEARKKFLRDQRDTTTPAAMAMLLERIAKHNILSVKSADLLLHHLQLNHLDFNRIARLLPANIIVAHKGGTLGEEDYAITNDVAVISDNKKQSRIILAIFVMSDKSSRTERADAIAHIAHLIFQHMNA